MLHIYFNLMRFVGIDNQDTGCSCTSYISNSGYGNCEKEFGSKGTICYVTQPSNCKDVRSSVSERDKGKQFSWEACQHRGDNIFIED